MRDGATIQLCVLRIETHETKTMVVYLVRSFGLMPESVSHDWHVQPSCQRPNRGPPRRREFSPGGNARVRIRLSSKLYNHTVRPGSRQSSFPTRFPDDFHIGKRSGSEGGRAAGETKVPRYARDDMALGGALFMHTRNSMVFRPGANAIFGVHFREPDTEDKKLRKDPFGGPCFEGTLRTAYVNRLLSE